MPLYRGRLHGLQILGGCACRIGNRVNRKSSWHGSCLRFIKSHTMAAASFMNTYCSSTHYLLPRQAECMANNFSTGVFQCLGSGTRAGWCCIRQMVALIFLLGPFKTPLRSFYQRVPPAQSGGARGGREIIDAFDPEPSCWHGGSAPP